MGRHRDLFIFGMAWLLWSGPALAYDFGPPDGYAGNPPFYDNCTICHYSYEPNSGDGLLELLGLPDSYEPGETYNLLVRIQDPGQKHWGFEITVLDDTDPSDYFNDGGTLAVTDGLHTQISENSQGTEDFLKQTSEGAYYGLPDGPVSWQFAWTAPEITTTSVTFYLASNAASGDYSFLYDYIYTQVVTLSPEIPTPALTSTWGKVKTLFR